MNFFDIVGPHLKDLTKNEQELFDFVLKHMDKIKGMSIREVASLAFVSTATFLRFVQKIGFAGYSEFTTVLKFTLLNQGKDKEEIQQAPFAATKNDYREDYIKNFVESDRVIQESKMRRVVNKLAESPDVFLFANGVSKHVTEYIYYQYVMAGFKVHFPRDKDYRRLMEKQVNNDSLVFILSYHGDDEEFVAMINKFLRRGADPMIVSVTQADNNLIQNMSDVNFYMFTDNIKVNEADITSHISMIAVMELILYQYIQQITE